MKKPEPVTYNPKCPHCDKEIDQLRLHKPEVSTFHGMDLSDSSVGLYSCPYCRRVLGFASVVSGED